MKKLLLVALIASVGGNINPQTWQPMGVPEGSGVTDMVYWKGGSPLDDKLWVTTGSYDWGGPNMQRGGVFYSATTPPYQGTWYRIGGSAGYYVGRTLEVGQDGNLYASLWRDPVQFPADALCRLNVQAATFGVLYQAQAGDNIFSIAVKNNPHSIFAGTRNGIIRSTNNGATFGYSNNGIPDSAWVYDIAIDSTGILAIATSKGVFISTNNGDNWLATTGIAPGDTVVTLLFVDNSTLSTSSLKSILVEPQWLYTGTHNGKLLRSFFEQEYTLFVLLYAFGEEGDEISYCHRLAEGYILGIFNQSRQDSNGTNISKFGEVGGVYESTDDGVSWNQINDGLPTNPRVSAFAYKEINESTFELYTGLFNDTTWGAGVYKLDYTVSVEAVDNQISSEYLLEQNYPNPFNPSTTIQFSIPEQSIVKLEVFNTLGEKVSTLVSEELKAGNYKYDWNAENLSSGIYFYRLNTNNFSEKKKMIFLK
jgi:Secretion system C-terminal sorting domain